MPENVDFLDIFSNRLTSDILLYLDEDEGKTTKEIANNFDVAVSTAARRMKTFREHGLVDSFPNISNPIGDKYVLTDVGAKKKEALNVIQMEVDEMKEGDEENEILGWHT